MNDQNQAKNQSAEPQLFHYFLVCGEVVYKHPAEENISAIRMNTMIRSNTSHVTAHQIGRAQQALQLNLFQRMNEPNIVVHDVAILSVSPLGVMTEEQFKFVPEGVKLQETQVQ